MVSICERRYELIGSFFRFTGRFPVAFLLIRLLGADEVFVRVQGNKLVSVVTAMDFTNAQHGALRYKLLVRDGNNKALAKTNSSVTWTKPEHTSWEEAGNFRVQSMLESFPALSDGFGKHDCSQCF